MMDKGIFRFQEVTITPNMDTTLFEKNGRFQVVKLNSATIYICPKVRLGTVPFGLLVTAPNSTIKQFELRMYDSATAKKSLEEKYAAHNRFLKSQLGCNFKEYLGRIKYLFVWGSICSYMDIKTGECAICVEYFLGHGVKFCVSEIRQNGNWQRINVAENWLDPLVTNRPEGGVVCAPERREYRSRFPGTLPRGISQRPDRQTKWKAG